MICRKRRGIDDVGNSGSLNDLSFLLIIFFIVIAGFNVNKGFLLKFQEKSKPRIVLAEDLMKCTLTSNSNGSMNIVLDDKKISYDELERRIGQMKKTCPNMAFLLLIEEDVSYQKAVDVIYLLRKNHLENFSFKLKAGGERGNKENQGLERFRAWICRS